MNVRSTSYEPIVRSILSRYIETNGDEWRGRGETSGLLSSPRKWQLIECMSIVIFCSLMDKLELGEQRACITNGADRLSSLKIDVFDGQRERNLEITNNKSKYNKSKRNRKMKNLSDYRNKLFSFFLSKHQFLLLLIIGISCKVSYLRWNVFFYELVRRAQLVDGIPASLKFNKDIKTLPSLPTPHIKYRIRDNGLRWFSSVRRKADASSRVLKMA